MKTLKENGNNLVMSLCEIVIGILLLVNPVKFTSGIIIAVGIVLVVRGVIDIISYFRMSPEDAVRNRSLSTGVIFCILGFFCVFCSDWFLATFSVLTVIYGVMILLGGIMKIQWVVDSFRLKRSDWLFSLISAVVSIAAAFIILRNPFTSTAALWSFAGVILIVEAVLDVIAVFMGRRGASDI